MQRMSFGREAHVQTKFGRVGTSHGGSHLRCGLMRSKLIATVPSTEFFFCRERRLLWFHKHFLNLGVKAALAVHEESTRSHERQHEVGPRWYSAFNPHQ